ncbi:MAG: anti-sigma factor family protein [bacterium]
MSCQDLQKDLMSYVSRELPEKQIRGFETHVSECSACAREVRQFRLLWNSLDLWEAQPVPQPIAKQILTTARAAIATETEIGSTFTWFSLRRILAPGAPLALGLLAAIMSAGILSSRMNLSLIHPLGLTAVGALWTGLYAIVFYFLFGVGKKEATSWRSFAQASLVAVGIFLAFTLISPMPSAVHFCRYYSVTQPVIERLSTGGSFFLFGALYALIPMSIAAYLSGSRSGNHPLARGSIAGVMFVALLAPSIYLQCAPFAFGVLLVWFGGALLGSVLGGVLGYWVRYRLAGNLVHYFISTIT